MMQTRPIGARMPIDTKKIHNKRQFDLQILHHMMNQLPKVDFPKSYLNTEYATPEMLQAVALHFKKYGCKLLVSIQLAHYKNSETQDINHQLPPHPMLQEFCELYGISYETPTHSDKKSRAKRK